MGTFESQQNVLAGISFSPYVTDHVWFQPHPAVSEKALRVFLAVSSPSFQTGLSKSSSFASPQLEGPPFPLHLIKSGTNLV